MERERVRLRVNYRTREVEVEGDAQAVEHWMSKLAPLVELWGEYEKDESDAIDAEVVDSRKRSDDCLPEEFGEYLAQFPSAMSDNDKFLMAAYFSQSKSPDNSSSTRAANDLLRNQGIRLSNPSVCVARNMAAKNMFALSKGLFRVSREGVRHLNDLQSRAS